MTTAPNVPADTNPNATRALRIIESVPTFAWSADSNGRFIYVSPNALTYLGARQEALNPLPDADEFGWRQVVHPDDYERVATRWRHCLQTGDDYDGEQRLRRADGVYRWFRNFGRPSRDSHGRITEWYGTAIDIEERKQAEVELRARERELSQLVDMVPSHIWRLAPDGEPIFFNKRMVDFLGLGVADMGKPGMRRLEAIIETIHPDDAATFRAGIKGCLVTGESFAMRYRLRRADGVYRWMSSRAEPMRDQDGRIVHWYGLCHDIDDQVQAEEALRRNERRLQDMIDALPVRIWSATSMGGPFYFNKRYQDHLRSNIPSFEALGEPGVDKFIQELIHPEDAPDVRRALQGCFETGNGTVMRFRWLENGGAYRWSECRVEPRRDNDGTVVQWYGASVDIDDEVRAHEALRQSERQLQQMIDAVPAMMWSTSREGTPSYVNKRFTDVSGATLKDITAVDGSPALGRIIHPDDLGETVAKVRESFRTGVPYVIRYRQLRRDGSYRWTETRAEALRDESGAILQWYGVSVDIHDMVIAQEALRDRERELSHLVDMVPSLLWRLSPDGEPNYFNKRTINFLGLDAADYDKPGMSRLAATLAAIIHPDDAAGVTEGLTHSLVTGEPFSMTYRLRRADGVYRWVSGRAEPMRDENGRVIQWYGLAHDIDNQMHAEEALRERERELSVLVDMVPSHLWRVAPDGETTLVNRHMVEFFGEDWKMKWDTAIDTVVHPDDLKEVLDEFGRCLRTGERFSMQYRLRRVDGVYRWMSGRAEPMLAENGQILQWFGLCHDIDDQVQADEALRRASDKLARATQAASLAELSASIAHELNQPLAAIVSNSEACARWLSAEPPNLERAKITAARIIRDANSAADVISRIRALFRRAPQSRSPDDINLMIREVCRLMADEIAAKGINIETNLDQELPSVAIDRVQIQQVLVNLIRNGIEAMDAVTDGGRPLHIRTCRDGVGAIRVEVRDAGKGFKDFDRVFEPFFTTKQNGMGMGLAICRSIVEAHGGRLWTANNETRGATVAFTLALAARDAP